MILDKYPIRVYWSAEDGGFIATCPDFPGLSAFGETRQEALTEAELVLGVFIETLTEDGDPLPDPTLLPPSHRRT